MVRKNKRWFLGSHLALSNLGFITTGLIMFGLLLMSLKIKEQICRTYTVAILYAATAVFLSPGSLLMHGTHTEWVNGQTG